MATHSKGDNVGKSVSLKNKLFDEAEKRRIALGLGSFSAYVQHLVREDLRKRGALVLEEETSDSNKRRK